MQESRDQWDQTKVNQHPFKIVSDVGEVNIRQRSHRSLHVRLYHTPDTKRPSLDQSLTRLNSITYDFEPVVCTKEAVVDLNRPSRVKGRHDETSRSSEREQVKLDGDGDGGE